MRGFPGACFFFFQAEDGIRDYKVTGVQTCALPIFSRQHGQRGREAFLLAPEDQLHVRRRPDRVLAASGRRLPDAVHDVADRSVGAPTDAGSASGPAPVDGRHCCQMTRLLWLPAAATALCCGGALASSCRVEAEPAREPVARQVWTDIAEFSFLTGLDLDDRSEEHTSELQSPC